MACNRISDTMWSKKVFNQFRVHNIVYHDLKNTTDLSAQIIVRCISKTVNTYKKGKKKKRIFRLLGSIAYDSRILSYSKKKQEVSIWGIGGRLKIPFICHNPKYIPYIKGEADLLYKNGKFYLFQNVDVPEENMIDVEKFIGIDFGMKNIATLSDGTKYNSEQLNKIKDKYFKTRRSIQTKGTKGCKKLLKRLSGREARFTSITNHTISKKIVAKAKSFDVGIAIEDLTHIQERITVRKKERRKYYSWSFYQLRSFLEYKSKLAGVLLIAVSPHYTSKICNKCKCIGNRSGNSFYCPSCGNISDADVNAAKNIAQLGVLCKPPRKEVSMLSLISHMPS